MKTERRASDKGSRLSFRSALLLQLTLVVCLGLALWGGLQGRLRDVVAQGTDVIQSFSLDADPGWTAQGDWAFGQPAGNGGEFGNPDPTGGHTGDHVYGYNLNGDYANDLPEYSLTTAAIDCSAYADVTLTFWRWLNVEHPWYDHAYLLVSNGGDWTTVWENAAEITDDAWQQVSYDISSVADNQPTVYIRWIMGPTDGGWRYSGWNIDDIELVGLATGPTPTPTSTPPATATTTSTSTPTATPTPAPGTPTPAPTPPPPCTFFEASGQLVIEAEHYANHVHPGEHSWQVHTSRSGYSGWGYVEAQPNNDTNYRTYEDVDDSPYLEYTVFFSTPGTYYVWVRGWAANDGDNSLHAGLDGVVTDASDRISNFAFNQWDWSRTTLDSGSPAATVYVGEAGLHVFSLFMREDGFQVDKIILTTQDGFTPVETGLAESFCCEPWPPPPTPGPPPGHRDCSQVLLQGNFEGEIDAFDGGSWHLGEEPGAAAQSSSRRHSGIFSLALRCFTQPWPPVDFHPWAYQQVTLPSNVVADTELSLTLYYLVEPRSTPREEDVLYVKLRDVGGSNIISDTVMANGASTAFTWVQYSVDLADGMADPASYADRDVQLYVHAPNPDDDGTTGFYLDDVRLDVCNTVPIPEIDPDKATVGGNLRVWMEGKLNEMVGVTVWAYRTDGGECRPGENLCVTTSIHDSTYHFYNIEPGAYVIYSETVVGTQLKFDSEAVTLEAGDVMQNLHLAL